MVLAFVGNKLDLEFDPETPRIIPREVYSLKHPYAIFADIISPISKDRLLLTRRASSFSRHRPSKRRMWGNFSKPLVSFPHLCYCHRMIYVERINFMILLCHYCSINSHIIAARNLPEIIPSQTSSADLSKSSKSAESSCCWCCRLAFSLLCLHGLWWSVSK